MKKQSGAIRSRSASAGKSGASQKYKQHQAPPNNAKSTKPQQQNQKSQQQQQQNQKSQQQQQQNQKSQQQQQQNQKQQNQNNQKAKQQQQQTRNNTNNNKPLASSLSPPKQKQQQQQQQQQQNATTTATEISRSASALSKTNRNKREKHNSHINNDSTTNQQQQQNQTEDVLLLVGSYHSAIQGFTFSFNRNEILLGSNSSSSSASSVARPPVPRFAGTQHVGCVYSIVSNGTSLVASAGNDERIALCSIKNHGTRATDLGTMQPASTVRSLAFVNSGGGHLLCGCEDGSLAVYRTRTWACEAVLKIHEKPLLSFAPTKNGALAVTLGADRFLTFVDLTRGTVLFRHKFAPAIAQQKQHQFQLQQQQKKEEEEKKKKAEKGEQEEEEEGEEAKIVQPPPSQRFGFVNQPPRQVVLSPCSEFVAVVAPFYVAFFDLACARLVCTIEVEDPQPENELQAGAFILTSSSSSSSNSSSNSSPVWHLLMSTEGGKIVAVSLPQNNSSSWVPVQLQELQQQSSSSSSLSAAQNQNQQQLQQLKILQHQHQNQPMTSRIRSVASMGSQSQGLVTAASLGEVRCWVATSSSSSSTTKSNSSRMEGEATTGNSNPLLLIKLIECSPATNIGGRITCVSSSSCV